MQSIYGFYRFNREALWQVLRMYDMGNKLLSGIKSMYIGSSACVRVKGCKNEQLRIDSGLRQRCIISPWLFNIYIYIYIYIYIDEGGEDGDPWEGGERVEIAWLLVCR